MARKKIQWHPLFTRLLRPRVEGYYEVRTGVPVGDLPRQADLVLIRRIRSEPPPFQGLWQRLTAWNLLEFKGPTEDARSAHLPLLVELGLGIARRLNEEHRREHGGVLSEGEISFWYLANRLGHRFRAKAERLLGALESVAAGLWRAWVLGHPVYLASTVDLALDDDSLPLHVLALEPPEQERLVGEYVTATQERVDAYGAMFSGLHKSVWMEVKAMARRSRRTITFDIQAAVETLGEEEVIRQIGAKKFVAELGVDAVLASLSASERRELKRRLADDEAKS